MPKPRFHHKAHPQSKRPRHSTASTALIPGAPSQRAVDAVSPWQSIPYPEQLEKKFVLLESALRSLISSNKLELNPVVASPVINGYRNKLDFTIGYDKAREPAVGFRVSQFRDGVTVEPPTECTGTAPAIAIEVAECVTRLIKAPGQLAPYDQVTHQGFWRALSVRWSQANCHLMVCLRAASRGDEGKVAMQTVVDALRNERFLGQEVTSMLVQWHDGVSHQPPLELQSELMFGADHIIEQILGMNFIVSPAAFFQANTQGANVLFSLVRAQVEGFLVPGQKATLLDVCCGTGVIGLLLAKLFHFVVGVDLCGPAILDARRNAEANQVSNARFIHAKAEDVFARLLKTSDGKKRPALSAVDETEMVRAMEACESVESFIAVVDPPRAGLHKSVLKSLRLNAKVRTVVYVSCNPTGSFVTDAELLCGTAELKGEPFVPLGLSPVDLFPNTEHCEMVCVFVRHVGEREPAVVVAAVAGEKEAT